MLRTLALPFNIAGAEQQISQSDPAQQQNGKFFSPCTLDLGAERLVLAASLSVMVCSLCEGTAKLKDTLLNFPFSFARTL